MSFAVLAAFFSILRVLARYSFIFFDKFLFTFNPDNFAFISILFYLFLRINYNILHVIKWLGYTGIVLYNVSTFPFSYPCYLPFQWDGDITQPSSHSQCTQANPIQPYEGGSDVSDETFSSCKGILIFKERIIIVMGLSFFLDKD